MDVTNFEKIKNMNIDEFAEWLDKHDSWENTPWMEWWNNTYCKNCEPVIGIFVDSWKESEFAWCELYGKCRFFQELDKTPDSLLMAKLWLESEIEHE